MALASAYGNYRENQITTASRGQLLLMTYDGLLRFLEEGRRAMSESRYDAQSTNITKAQTLLLELLSSLDHHAAPELANNLDRLYRYMYDRLTLANVKDDEKSLTEVAGLLGNLREAWAEAERMTRTQMSVEPSLNGGYTA
ncbi:MAG: flagellar export chaperone FliS [Armatimonadota bacterium]